jgi:hypothetical protein
MATKSNRKPKGKAMTMEEFANYVVNKKRTQVLLTPDTLDNGAAVVNVGDEGGYVMVELTPVGILVTVFNDAGDVLSEQEYNLGA